uniref:Uncharacterized protein n=1 Tax=Arundo donax TaxID=35708 RepID=A0A0A8YVB2_ARUDO
MSRTYLRNQDSAAARSTGMLPISHSVLWSLRKQNAHVRNSAW